MTCEPLEDRRLLSADLCTNPPPEGEQADPDLNGALFFHDEDGRLATLDLDTGDVDIIGTMNVVMTDIAFDACGNLYGVSDWNAYRINPNTAAIELNLGQHSIPGANALEFSRDGTLYAAGDDSTSLYTIDLATGVGTQQGDLGFFSSGDLSFVGDNLFLSAEKNGFTDQLIEIDLSDGGVAAELKGDIAVSSVFGMVTRGSTLYGLSETALLEIDTATGEAERIVYQFGDQGVGDVFGAGLLDLDIEKPNGDVHGRWNVLTGGGTTHSFEVEYTDNIAVDVSTLDDFDVEVRGPNGFVAAADFVAVDVNSDGTPRIATYQFNAPGGSWGPEDNGSYWVWALADQVSDLCGNNLDDGRLGSFLVSVPDEAAPTATLNVTDVTASGGAAHSFTVTYADDNAIDVSDLDNADLLVTGPDSFSASADFVSVDVNSDGTPREATYQLSAPGGSWDAGDNGTYTITMRPNQVSDTANKFVRSGTLGQFIVSIPDTDPPTATLRASDVVTNGGATHAFTVRYEDNVGLDGSTLDNNDLIVTGPSGFSEGATFIPGTTVYVGDVVVAAYYVNAPGGSWDPTDNGTYTVTMQSSQVCDTSANCVSPGSLGDFTVDISVEPVLSVAIAVFDGVGTEGWVAETDTLNYEIVAENNPVTALAPAQQLRLEQSLESDLDAASFRLGSIAFGATTVNDAVGLTSYAGRIDVRGSLGVYVDITAGVDLGNRLAFWELTAIDPSTDALPTDPLMGFLPPNVNGTEGKATVLFTIQPNSGANTGDRIDTSVTMYHDGRGPIYSPSISLTVDAATPSSAVAELPVESEPSFDVTWAGADDTGGSGISGYDVYVSDDGASYTQWLSNTPLTQQTYTGEEGHHYAFFSVARDLVGHREAAPATADAETDVPDTSGPDSWQNPDNRLDVTADGFVVPRDALLIINELNGPEYSAADGKLPTVFPSTAPPPFLDVDGDGYCSPRDVLIVVNYLHSQAEGEASPRAAVNDGLADGARPSDASRAAFLAYSESLDDSILDDIVVDVATRWQRR